jgi:NADH-quinone oxidoreductase subunit N
MVAGVMTVFMFSLAGLPPMVGFFAKLAIIQALVSTNVQLYIALAVVAVLFSLIGAYYYLRVIKVMWFDEPVQTASSAAAPASRPAGPERRGSAPLRPFSGGLMAMCRDAIVKALAS